MLRLDQRPYLETLPVRLTFLGVEPWARASPRPWARPRGASTGVHGLPHPVKWLFHTEYIDFVTIYCVAFTAAAPKVL